MNSHIVCYLLGLGLLAAAPVAHAQGITYDCDTAAGHFSELTLPAGSVPFTVSGKVKLNATAKDKTYIPSTKLIIADATETGQPADVYAGFTLGVLPLDPKKAPAGRSAVQVLGFSVNGKDDEILPKSLEVQLGTVQPFRLTYDGSTVAVTLGDESRNFSVKASKPIVRLICSTGEFLYTDLQIVAGR